MRTQARTTAIGMCLTAAAALLTACGNNSAQPKAAVKTLAVVATPSPSAASPATPRVATAPRGGDFCAVVKAGVSDAMKVFPKDMGDPAQYAAYAAYVKGMNARMNATAPAEIRADVRTATKVSNAIVGSYNGKTITIPPAIRAQVQSPEFMAAAKRLGAYSKTRCGVDASSLAGGSAQ